MRHLSVPPSLAVRPMERVQYDRVPTWRTPATLLTNSGTITPEPTMSYLITCAPGHLTDLAIEASKVRLFFRGAVSDVTLILHLRLLADSSAVSDRKLKEVHKRLNELRELVQYYEQTSDMMVDAVNENVKEDDDDEETEDGSLFEAIFDSEQENREPITNIRYLIHSTHTHTHTQI